MFSFGYFPGVWGLKADVSEPSIGFIFLDRWRKMEPIEGSETSAFKPQMPGKYPKENILHKEHGESLKSRQLIYNLLVYHRLQQKIKCTLVQALRLCTGHTAHRGSRGTPLLFLTTALDGGEGSVSHPDHSLPPGKTLYPLYRRLGGSQGRSGQVPKIFPPTPHRDWIPGPSSL